MPIYFVQICRTINNEAGPSRNTCQTSIEEVQVSLQEIDAYVSPAELENFEHALFRKEAQEEAEKKKIAKEQLAVKKPKGRPPKANVVQPVRSEAGGNSTSTDSMKPSGRIGTTTVASSDDYQDDADELSSATTTLALAKPRATAQKSTESTLSHQKQSRLFKFDDPSTSASADESLDELASGVLYLRASSDSSSLASVRNRPGRPRKRLHTPIKTNFDAPRRLSGQFKHSQSPLRYSESLTYPTITATKGPDQSASGIHNESAGMEIDTSSKSSSSSTDGRSPVEYEVEKVLNHTQSGGNTWYFVKWAGHPIEEGTWLPEGDLEGAKDVLSEYKQVMSI